MMLANVAAVAWVLAMVGVAVWWLRRDEDARMVAKFLGQIVAVMAALLGTVIAILQIATMFGADL